MPGPGLSIVPTNAAFLTACSAPVPYSAGASGGDTRRRAAHKPRNCRQVRRSKLSDRRAGGIRLRSGHVYQPIVSEV